MAISNQSVLTVQRKNWEPLVLGPALAMDKMPGPSCLSLLCMSNSVKLFAHHRPTGPNQTKKKNRHAAFKRLRGVSQVLVLELVAVDGFAASAVVVGEVAALAHEVRNDAVEAGALETEALLAGAERAEVLTRLGHTAREGCGRGTFCSLGARRLCRMRLKMAGRQHNSRFVFELHGDAARGGTADGHVEKHLLLNATDASAGQFFRHAHSSRCPSPIVVNAP